MIRVLHAIGWLGVAKKMKRRDVAERVEIYVNCAYLSQGIFMANTSDLPANDTAERVVRHFQAEGFTGITEALVIRLRLKKGSRAEIDSAFTSANTPPVGEYFELRPCGFFSSFRTFGDAKAAIQSDFSADLRQDIPRVYFDSAPVVLNHPLATGTRYDLMVKLHNNIDGCAYAILLNDPESSLFEYLGTHHGNAWEQIISEFETAAVSFGLDIDLL